MLNENQLKCISLMIGTNKTQKQIAREINITEKTICEWKKQKEFTEEIEKELQQNFGSLAIEAQKQLNKLLKSSNENVRMQAIKDVLDRAGYRPKEKIEHSGNVNNPFEGLTIEELRQMMDND